MYIDKITKLTVGWQLHIRYHNLPMYKEVPGKILTIVTLLIFQVEAKKEIVACDEALANEAAAAAQAIRDDCENDLAEAIPALQVKL